MSLADILGRKPAGAWKWPGSPRDAQCHDPNKGSRPQGRLEAFSNLTSRNSLSAQGSASHGSTDKTASSQRSSFKKIKLEHDLPANNQVPKFGGFVDLTLDSSDDDMSKEPVVNKPVKKAIPEASALSGSCQNRTKSNTRDGEGMIGIETTKPISAPLFQIMSMPRPANFSQSNMEDDYKPVITGAQIITVKQLTASGPFNCDDSDDSCDGESAIHQPPIPRGRSPTPRISVPDAKVLEEKAAQKKHAAMLRKAAEAKRKASALEKAATIHTTPNAQSPTSSTPGRNLDSDRLPVANTRTPSISESREQFSPLQKKLSGIGRRPTTTASAPDKTIPPPTMRKAVGNSRGESPSAASRAANVARSHLSKLRNQASSHSAITTRGSSEGVAQQRNAALVGDDPFPPGKKEAVVSAVKEKPFIDSGAKEQALARANKKAEAEKAALAAKCQKAENDAFRAAEQRRRLDARKAEKEIQAEKAKLEKKRLDEEHSRAMVKRRLDREARELFEAEERKAAAAMLRKTNKEELERKQEAHKAHMKAIERRREEEKKDRIMKQKDRNARMHAVAADELEVDAADPQHEDSGQLVLEGDPTGGQNQQVSNHASAAQTGPDSTTQTGPFSLTSAAGTAKVMQKMANSSVIVPATLSQEIVQEKPASENVKDHSARENAGTKPSLSHNAVQKANPFFADKPSRKAQIDQAATGFDISLEAARSKGHQKKLLPLLPEDAKIIQWRDQEDMPFDKITLEYKRFTSKKLSDATIRRRYRQVGDAVKRAKIPYPLMKLLADGDHVAQDQVNLIVEAALPELAIASGQTRPSSMSAGPIKLPPLREPVNNNSPLSQVPKLRLKDPQYDAPKIQPRSELAKLAPLEERPTVGGKSLPAVYEMTSRARVEPNDEDDDEDDAINSAEDDDLFNAFEPQDYQDYGFQVQRRELTTEDAQEGFGIENQEWMPCGDVFANRAEANVEAIRELTTILPGSPYYFDPSSSTMRMLQDENGLQLCHAYHPIHGECQTRVAKVLQAPIARMRPPTAKEIRKERTGRRLWYIVKTLTIMAPYNELFEDPPEPLVKVIDDRIAYSDPELVNKRAAQDFVDATFRSDSRSLPTRSEEKRERVEGYLAGILVNKMFEAEMELVSGMEGNCKIRETYEVKEGSKVILTVRIEAGALAGPMN